MEQLAARVQQLEEKLQVAGQTIRALQQGAAATAQGGGYRAQKKICRGASATNDRLLRSQRGKRRAMPTYSS